MIDIEHLPALAPFTYASLIDYLPGQVNKLFLLRSKGLNMILLAFDAGQSLPEHQTPGPALVHLLEGEGSFRVHDREIRLQAGQTLLLPAGVPHSVTSDGRFKMLLAAVLPLD